MTTAEEKKEAFVFYETFIESVKELEPADQYRFLCAIINYGIYGAEPEFVGLEKALWIQIRNAIDQSKSRRKSAQNNGSKGGRPRTEEPVIGGDFSAAVSEEEEYEDYIEDNEEVIDIDDIEEEAENITERPFENKEEENRKEPNETENNQTKPNETENNPTETKKNLKKPEIKGWQKFANTSYKKKVLIHTFCFACMGIFTSCDALAAQKQFTHDAVFEFGLNNFSEFTPISNFTNSFNSPTVRYVILQSDGLSWQATPVSDISNQINEIITNARPEQLHKLRGRGILFDVYIDNPTDSLNLAQIGLKFKNAVHSQNINRWHANQKQK